jgi:hypothetical protein
MIRQLDRMFRKEGYNFQEGQRLYPCGFMERVSIYT